METDHFDSKDNSSDTDIHNCSICLEEFKAPKYLPCLHTFCEACLNTYIISSSKSGESPPEHFNCPVCRAEVKPPDPSASVEKWASLMPGNSTVHCLTEGSLTSSEKPTEKTFECHPCKFDGENISGEFWCFECQEFLCDRCKKEHVRHKSLRSHKLVPATDVTTQPDITVVTNDLEEPCTEHKGEVLKVYCIDHQKMCCVLCLSINHRKCENIKTFDEMAENLKKKAEAEQFSDKMKEMSSKVERISARKKENITDIHKQQTIMLYKADDLIQKAKAKLDKCHEEFKYHISNHQKVQTTKLLDAADKIDSFQNCLTSSLKIWTTIRATRSPKQIFVTFERIKERIESQRKELEAYLKVDQIVSFDIKLSKQVLEITDLTSLAEIEVKTTPSEESLSLHIDNCQYQENINASIFSPCINDLEPVRVWNIKDSGWFTGGTFLNDGRLLLVDYSAKSLTVFNKCGEKNICYNLSFEPWDAVQHSDGSIYVSSFSDCTIRVYTILSNALQEVKSIKTDKSSLHAINITPDNLILVECSMCIYIMTMDGKTKRTIEASGNNSFIATSTSDTESVFYFCDGTEVVCQSVSGKELLRYKIPGIKGTRGISLDTWGNIYVCGRDSENVHVVSKDGKLSRVLLSNIGDVCKPYKVGFDRSGSKFFVTGFENGTVAVYKLNVKT